MKKKKMDRYFVEQKLIGLVIFLIGLMAFFVSEDGTAGIILIPFGALLMFTKQELIFGSSKEKKR